MGDGIITVGLEYPPEYNRVDDGDEYDRDGDEYDRDGDDRKDEPPDRLPLLAAKDGDGSFSIIIAALPMTAGRNLKAADFIFFKADMAFSLSGFPDIFKGELFLHENAVGVIIKNNKAKPEKADKSFIFEWRSMRCHKMFGWS